MEWWRKKRKKKARRTPRRPYLKPGRRQRKAELVPHAFQLAEIERGGGAVEAQGIRCRRRGLDRLPVVRRHHEFGRATRNEREYGRHRGVVRRARGARGRLRRVGQAEGRRPRALGRQVRAPHRFGAQRPAVGSESGGVGAGGRCGGQTPTARALAHPSARARAPKSASRADVSRR